MIEMNKITEITRRDIYDLFCNGIDIDIGLFFEENRVKYSYYGRLKEIDFLNRIYSLEELPSNDSRYPNAQSDIWQHTVKNDDYPDNWVFEDGRFQLLEGSDEIYLKFICEVFHPAVRYENGYWKEYLDEINKMLKNDGYEIFVKNKISNKDVYGWRIFDNQASVFVPFSQRNKKQINSRSISLSINMNTRKQIYRLIMKFNEVYRETDNTCLDYNISTIEMIFRDLRQFYDIKCFDKNNNYKETDNFEEFIYHNYPFYVFDTIEACARYNTGNSFCEEMNALFKLNELDFQIEGVMLTNVHNVKLSNQILGTLQEVGVKELLQDANYYYANANRKIAVEQLWCAFERLKTYYYPVLNKKDSANKIIQVMGNGNPQFTQLFEKEFKE